MFFSTERFIKANKSKKKSLTKIDTTIFGLLSSICTLGHTWDAVPVIIKQYCEPQYCKPQYGEPQYCEPQYCEPQYGEPPYCEPPYCEPQYCEPQYCKPQYCEPQYGEPQYCEPQYCEPQYCEPQYCEPQSCEPQYCEPQYGEPQWCVSIKLLEVFKVLYYKLCVLRQSYAFVTCIITVTLNLMRLNNLKIAVCSAEAASRSLTE